MGIAELISAAVAAVAAVFAGLAWCAGRKTGKDVGRLADSQDKAKIELKRLADHTEPDPLIAVHIGDDDFALLNNLKRPLTIERLDGRVISQEPLPHTLAPNQTHRIFRPKEMNRDPALSVAVTLTEHPDPIHVALLT